jgi:multidrug efflux pump subunit AcrA (membrane-fusion protein)
MTVQLAHIRGTLRDTPAILSQRVVSSMSIAKWLNAASILLLLGASGSGASLSAQKQIAAADWQSREAVKAARADDMPVHRVVPGQLRVTVVERGVVEASWNAGVYCRVAGGAAISWIVPDGTMEVNAKVREPVIDRIDRGLKARIRVDAFPRELLSGTVSEVAPLPDPVCFFIGFIKTYTTKIQIDKGPAGVRPGMTAQVEILVNDLENVLSVPVEAVVHYDDKDHVAVQLPACGFEWREVTLGLSNERFIEVKQGIWTGESVAIKPDGLLSEAQTRALQKTNERADREAE